MAIEHTAAEWDELLQQVRSAPAAWLFDLDTLRFVAVSQNVLHLYGYTEEEFLKLTLLDIRPPDTVTDVLHLLKDRTRVGDIGTWTHLTKDGRQFRVTISCRNYRVGRHELRLATASSIERVA